MCFLKDIFLKNVKKYRNVLYTYLFSRVGSNLKGKNVVLFWRTHSVGRSFQIPSAIFPWHVSSFWAHSLCFDLTRFPVRVLRINFVLVGVILFSLHPQIQKKKCFHHVFWFICFFVVFRNELFVIYSPLQNAFFCLFQLTFYNTHYCTILCGLTWKLHFVIHRFCLYFPYYYKQ